ncbi:MAG: undecaprenyl-diphosphate phosphatase [Pelagibacterales bacterium]|nr:undecaprenyl-diphosphate phosphatase [Pelagibacterales bacterium]
MISNYLEVLILSIIQGISEFLPVSSSAHLIIFSNIINFSNNSLIFDVGLHLGSLLAILFYFRKELLNILNDKKLFNLLLIGSIPLILFGYIFYTTGIINSFRNLKIIAWTTLIFGLLMYFSDTFKIKKKIEKDLTIKNILIIGVMQILAIIPGVSRSGITITAGRFLNFDRYDSTKISFYLSIPALMGASVLSLKDAVNENIEFNFFLIISIILSFIFSYLTIKYFLIYTKKFSLKFFVIYRVVLSIIIFLIIYN